MRLPEGKTLDLTFFETHRAVVEKEQVGGPPLGGRLEARHSQLAGQPGSGREVALGSGAVDAEARIGLDIGEDRLSAQRVGRTIPRVLTGYARGQHQYGDKYTRSARTERHPTGSSHSHRTHRDEGAYQIGEVTARS